MNYLTQEQWIRLTLNRKRRLRWIYKWRHGLKRRHQPAHGDRAKLRRLELYDRMRLHPMLQELADRFAESVGKSILTGHSR